MTVTDQSTSLADRIEQAIRQATHGRIGELSVESHQDEIVLRGRCATFTCKKLVQDAVVPLLGEARLVNAIRVG